MISRFLKSMILSLAIICIICPGTAFASQEDDVVGRRVSIELKGSPTTKAVDMQETQAPVEIPAKEDDFINDFGMVISKETEEQIKSIGDEIYNDTGVQITVLTIESLQGAVLEQFTANVFKDWNIGGSKTDGVLIFISREDRLARIEVGKAIQSQLTAVKCGKILDDYMLPAFAREENNNAVISTYAVVTNEICKLYDLDPLDYGITVESVGEIDEDEKPKSKDMDQNLVFLIIAVVAVIIIGFLIRGVAKTSKKQKKSVSPPPPKPGKADPDNFNDPRNIDTIRQRRDNHTHQMPGHRQKPRGK